MPVPDEAKHPAGGHLMYNPGDFVELDADPHGAGGASDRVSAICVVGPPKKLTREEIDAGQSPYRPLALGDVTVRNSAKGNVVSIAKSTIFVRVPKHEVAIRDGALLPRELKLLEQLFSRQGGWTFGFNKENVVPLRLENERVWAALAGTRGSAYDAARDATAMVSGAEVLREDADDNRRAPDRGHRPFAAHGFARPRTQVTAREIIAEDEDPKERIEWRGHPICIECSDGDIRYEGKEFETFIPEGIGYGYFEGIPGDDGDSLDVIVGSYTSEEDDVFLAVQLDPEGAGNFFQWKVLVGFETEAAAESTFRLLWPAWMFGGLTTIPADEFFELVLPKITADDDDANSPSPSADHDTSKTTEGGDDDDAEDDEEKKEARAAEAEKDVFVINEGEVESLTAQAALGPPEAFGQDWLVVRATSSKEAMARAQQFDQGSLDPQEELSAIVSEWSGWPIDRLLWHLQGAKNSDGDLYLRFGAPPAGGRSKNWTSNTYESGVAVYPLEESGGLFRLREGGAMHAGTGAFLIAGGAQPYLVRGKQVGVGSDGEPLLEGAQFISRLEWDQARGGFARVAVRKPGVGEECEHCGETMRADDIFGGEDRWFHRCESDVIHRIEASRLPGPMQNMNIPISQLASSEFGSHWDNPANDFIPARVDLYRQWLRNPEQRPSSKRDLPPIEAREKTIASAEEAAQTKMFDSHVPQVGETVYFVRDGRHRARAALEENRAEIFARVEREHREAKREKAPEAISWHGLTIALECRGGEKRPSHSQALPAEFRGLGYFEGLRDKNDPDEQELDAVIGPGDLDGDAFLAIQLDKKDRFRQFKVFLGFADEAGAEAAFKLVWHPDTFGGIWSLPAKRFRKLVLPRLTKEAAVSTLPRFNRCAVLRLEVDPKRITAPHGVKNTRKRDRLVESMHDGGWDGRPLLVYRSGGQYQALTGSHRLDAAVKAELARIPVLCIEDKDFSDGTFTALDEAGDNYDRLRALEDLRDEKPETQEAYELMMEELASKNEVRRFTRSSARTCPHCQQEMNAEDIFGEAGREFHRPCTHLGPISAAVWRRPHAHAYPWGGHEIAADDHPHTSIPEPPTRAPAEPNYFDQNVNRGQDAGSYYQQLARNYGKLVPGQPTSLKHYDYRQHEPAIDDLIRGSGYETYYAGGKYGKPDLAARNYNTGHLMVYDPTSNSADDEAATRSWRKIHELSHAQTYGDLNAKYGEGRRIGKLGYHRSLREAKRAVEWEAMAVAKQRQLSEQVGHPIDDADFAREWNTVLHDAVHRAVTGKFTNPDEEGFQPADVPVPLETALGQLEDYAFNTLGLADEDSLLTPEQKAKVRATRLAQMRPTPGSEMKTAEPVTLANARGGKMSFGSGEIFTFLRTDGIFYWVKLNRTGEEYSMPPSIFTSSFISSKPKGRPVPSDLRGLRRGMPMRTKRDLPPGTKVFPFEHEINDNERARGVRRVVEFEYRGPGAPNGYIEIWQSKDSDRWHVGYVTADHGWGPLLYDTAMAFASKNGGGLAPDPRTVSESARAVWQQYRERPDVESTPFEQDWHDDPMLSSVYRMRAHAKIRVSGVEVSGVYDASPIVLPPVSGVRIRVVGHEIEALRWYLPPREQLWNMLLETSGIPYPPDFVNADGWYRTWRRAPRKSRGPKPEWNGGEVDALNHALNMRVSGPYEGFERLLRGARTWEDFVRMGVIDVLRDVPGLENLRLPDEVTDRLAREQWDRDMALYEHVDDSPIRDDELFDPDAMDFDTSKMIAGIIRVTAQELTVGPDAPPVDPFTVPGQEPATDPTQPAKPVPPAAVQHLKLRNQQLYERAIAAGGREERPGTVSIGAFGWVWHPSVFGEIRDPSRYSKILDALEQRVTAFEQRKRAQIDDEGDAEWLNQLRQQHERPPQPSAYNQVRPYEAEVDQIYEAVESLHAFYGADVMSYFRPEERQLMLVLADALDGTPPPDLVARAQAAVDRVDQVIAREKLPAIIDSAAEEAARYWHDEEDVTWLMQRAYEAALDELPEMPPDTFEKYWAPQFSAAIKQLRGGDVRIAQTARDIVVTIPAGKVEEIEAEEADVAAREQAGETGIRYFWEMKRLPKEQPSKIYFVWNGAARAYHDVLEMSPNPVGKGGRIYMSTAIHEIPPVSMSGFQGFRYFDAIGKRGVFEIGEQGSESDPRVRALVEKVKQLEEAAQIAYERDDPRAEGLDAAHAEALFELENIASEVQQDPGADWEMYSGEEEETLRYLAADWALMLEGKLSSIYGIDNTEAALAGLLRGKLRVPQATTDAQILDAAKDAHERMQYLRSRTSELRAGKTPGEKAVVVIRIPQALARMWPKEITEKNGSPHFTLAYIPGPHNEEARAQIIAIAGAAARETAPIPVELEKGVDYFTSDNPKEAAAPVVASKSVHPETAERMAALHWKLIEALEDAGFKPAVRDEFKAHSTLAYLVDEDFPGHAPEGGFTADTIEVWGWEDTPRFRLSGTRESKPFAVEGAKRRRHEKRRRFAGETFYLPMGGWHAHKTRHDAGKDAEEIRLDASARVLREGAEEYLEMSREGVTGEELLDRAREAGYDAVLAGKRLAIINEDAIADRRPAARIGD